MNLEVVGRHALLFDDDAMALFVNSADALVDWNSLAIDRYDVRHLLSGPPPPRKRRSPLNAEADLEYERWLDLPSTDDEQRPQQADSSISFPCESAGRFHSVGFAYAESGESTDHKRVNAELEELRFTPPFPVPEYLIHNLPPTEKVHQIIARTAKFVGEHGSQSEIVLRVKQGDNPTFGFLMPDHHLHAYFRFLIDHQELTSATNSNLDVKNSTLEQNQSDATKNGALSLLSSLYSMGEDDEGAHKSDTRDELKANKVIDALQEVSQEAGQTGKPPVVPAGKESSEDLQSKEKALSKQSLVLGSGIVGTSKSVKKVSKALSEQFAVGTMKNMQAPDMLEMPKPEAIILEPPLDTKKLIDKIVEFVQRNGKEVETVLREQDVKHGRFPFLVPSNLYHPYYLKMLQKSQEPPASEKSAPTKDNSARHGKKAATSKDCEAFSTHSAEFSFDANGKEKFTMVLGKSKEKELVQTSKASETPNEVGMDTAAIAAILQAATRGAKLPNSIILSKTIGTGSSQNMDGDRQPSGTNVSWTQNSSQKLNGARLHNPSVPLAKTIAKSAALAAASEADSSEASMTKEQKLKSERLKRAKMFAAMIKGAGASIKTEVIRGNSEECPESGASGLVRGFSVDQTESGASALVGAVGIQDVKEREGSSIPPDVGFSEEIEKLEMKMIDNEDKKRRSKRSYRSKSIKNIGFEEDVSALANSSHKHRSHGSDEESADDDVVGHLRKKHRSHRSDDKDVNVDKHDSSEHSRKKHKSHRYNDENDDVDENDGQPHSRKKHKSHKYDEKSDDEDENDGKPHSRKKHKSHRFSHHSKERHRHGKERSSKNHRHRDRHRHHSSDDDEDDHHRSSMKAHKNRLSNAEDVPLPAKEIASSPIETSAATASDIPDELRAKVRAMLLANL